MKWQNTLMSKKFFTMLLGGTLTMMVVSVLLMSDSVIAGAVLGSNAVAGITLVIPIYSLAAFFGSVFSLGVPIVYSTEMGRFNKDGADRVFGLGLLMSIIVGVFLFLMATIFGNLYLQSTSPMESVLHEAQGYLFWMRFTMLVMPIQMLIAAVVYSDGDETLSTVANLVQGVGNIAASIILSRIMGVRGIGLASFLFNCVALGILFIHFLKKSNSLKLNLYFSGSLLKRIVRYSIIDSSSYLFLAILTAVLNYYVSIRFGTEYLILVSSITLCRELQMVFDGIGEAITPILSVYIGEESKGGVEYIYRLANRTAIVEGAIVTVLLILMAPLVPMVIGISEPQLISCAITGIRILALGSVFVSLLYLLTSYYLVIEKILLGLVTSAIRDVFLSVILVFIMGGIFGVNGVFAGLAMAPLLAYGLLMLYITKRYGKENCPTLISYLPGSRGSYLLNFNTSPEEIIHAQKEIEGILIEKDIDRRTIGRVKLLVEELFMLIWEKNGGKDVLCECTVILRPEGVQLITKDEGILFDISEDDVTVTSIVSLAVSAYMNKMEDNKNYLTTISFNRSSFLVKTQS